MVTALPWNSTVWELFRAVRAAGTGRIAISEMVLIELLAQRGREYSSALDNATAAHQALWKLQFGDIDATHVWPAVYSSEDSLQKWEDIYRQTMEVLPLTQEAAVEGLRREAHRLRPARTSGKMATGSRDAAIWMTVLEQAKLDPTCPVYFVSSNVTDFGPKRKALPRHGGRGERRRRERRISHHLDEALSRISRRENLAHDDEGLAERVTAATTTQALWSFIVESMEGQQVAGAVVDFDDEDPFVESESAWSEYQVRVIEVASGSDEVSYAVGTADGPGSRSGPWPPPSASWSAARHAAGPGLWGPVIWSPSPSPSTCAFYSAPAPSASHRPANRDPSPTRKAMPPPPWRSGCARTTDTPSPSSSSTRKSSSVHGAAAEWTHIPQARRAGGRAKGCRKSPSTSASSSPARRSHRTSRPCAAAAAAGPP